MATICLLTFFLFFEIITNKKKCHDITWPCQFMYDFKKYFDPIMYRNSALKKNDAAWNNIYYLSQSCYYYYCYHYINNKHIRVKLFLHILDLRHGPDQNLHSPDNQNKSNQEQWEVFHPMIGKKLIETWKAIISFLEKLWEDEERKYLRKLI